MFDDTTAQYVLFSLALVSVLLTVIGGRFAFPILLLFGRWIRWFLFAALFAFFVKIFEFSYRPDWVLFTTGFALWFVLETGYNWIAIKALSRSELPLFPDFYPNEDGDEWPAEKKFIELKDWLRSEKFTRLAALKAELFQDTHLRASVYECPDKLTRIQILFIPKRKGDASACYTVSTATEDGQRMITDNLFLPYGGYYPENWNLVRRPLIASLPRLLSIHRKRVLGLSSMPTTTEEDALEELNDQQRILEKLNVQTGFLVPIPRQEEEGKITAEGCYRMWKEMWLLAYLGKSVS